MWDEGVTSWRVDCARTWLELIIGWEVCRLAEELEEEDGYQGKESKGQGEA